MASEIVKAEDYALVKSDTDVAALLDRNLGGENLSAFDLRRVKVPGSGGTTWMVPSIMGEQAEKEIVGVIVFQKLARVYWKSGLDEGGSLPPDCSSDDCVTGSGDPGGSCGSCPNAEWGSDPKGGRGQACKQTRQLFVMRPNDRLPLMVNVPPTSLANAKSYLFGLTSEGVSYEHAITRLSLSKTKNADGTDYAVIEFECGGAVPAEHQQVFSAVRDSLEPKLRSVKATM